MKTLQSILKKTILPLAVSSAIFFGGCGEQEKMDSKGIGKFTQSTKQGKTNYIESIEEIILREKDFEKAGGWNINLLYDIENKIKKGLTEEYGKEIERKINARIAQKNTGWTIEEMKQMQEQKRAYIYKEGFTIGINNVYGVVSSINWEKNKRESYAIFPKETLVRDEQGNLLIKNILDELPNVGVKNYFRFAGEVQLSEQAEMEYALFVKSNVGNSYIVEKIKPTSEKNSPPEFKIKIYKLVDKNIPRYDPNIEFTEKLLGI